MTEITIVPKSTIGENRPCFIIAEAGVNHNGSLELAKELVDAAKEARADAVKFQTFTTEDLVTKTTEMAEYQKKSMGRKESQLEMLKKLELRHLDFLQLQKYCIEKKIIFLSTPHTDDAVEFLAPLVPGYKIASGDLTNIPLLQKVARKRKPIILSTGMGTLREVKEAVEAIKNEGNQKIILLHCTTSYPCPMEEVNLKAMLTLRKVFGALVGYSDHTLGITVPIMARTLGAVVIEKHFTLDKNLPGPDHRASLEPHELKEMVQTIREVEKALGDEIKKPTPHEKKNMLVARKSIIARVDIPKGSKVTLPTVIVKRPGTGIAPKYLSRILGRVTKRDILKDSLIAFSDLQ